MCYRWPIIHCNQERASSLALKIWLGLTLGLATGCSSARLVETKPGVSGVVAVSSAQDAEARGKAQTLMAETCGSKTVEIFEEAEQVIGTSSRKRRFGGSGLTTGSTRTRQNTEWRIHFKCVAKS